MWEIVVGFLSATFILPLIQQPTWTPRGRALATFLWSTVAGLGTIYLTDKFRDVDTPREVATSVLLVLVSAIATYYGFAKPTGIAPSIEHATALSARRVR
jgi:peptidoglycan/LPS O-acetylase OafA/YrhL